MTPYLAEGLVRDAAVTTPAADPEQIDEPLVCTAIEDVTHDVKSFVLSRAAGTPLAFEPGQYLIVTVGAGEQVMQRCYTVASPPTRPDRLTITVKRVPDGPASAWLHDRLAVGDTLAVTGPYGGFSTARHPAAGYLFLSAGSGITPVMSMTRALRERPGPCDVVFVHSALSPRDIIFRDELEAIAARPGFSVTVICEGDAPDERWEGPTGRLTLRTLLRVAPDLHEREVFTCGPAGYMDAVREMLALAGVEPGHCHEESFDLSRPALPAGDQAPTGTLHSVEFRRSDRTVACREDESILDAAHRAGLRPPSMCARGMCGTCRTTLLSGDVDLQDAGGLRPCDVERGQVLLCCSRPLGDVVVDA